MAGKVITIDGSSLTGAEALHDAFSEAVGFPDWYGRNWNAWIDLMTYLDSDSETTKLFVAPGESVTIVIGNVKEFRAKARDLYDALVECSAFVNWRRLERGAPAYLCLAFHD